MIALPEFPGAQELASQLRRLGFYAAVFPSGVMASASVLSSVYCAVIPADMPHLIPEIGNADDGVAIVSLGIPEGMQALCHGRASRMEELPTLLAGLLSERMELSFELTVTEGLALFLRDGSAEYMGAPLNLSGMEFHVLRCIALSKRPLSALETGCFCRGKECPREIMTVISHINRKADPKRSSYPGLVHAPVGGGYRIGRKAEKDSI